MVGALGTTRPGEHVAAASGQSPWAPDRLAACKRPAAFITFLLCAQLPSMRKLPQPWNSTNSIREALQWDLNKGAVLFLRHVPAGPSSGAARPCQQDARAMHNQHVPTQLPDSGRTRQQLCVSMLCVCELIQVLYRAAALSRILPGKASSSQQPNCHSASVTAVHELSTQLGKLVNATKQRQTQHLHLSVFGPAHASRQSTSRCIRFITRRSGPYALFGHSMGAWLAWEVLQELARRQLPLPLRLYVSGNRCAAAHKCFRCSEK